MPHRLRRAARHADLLLAAAVLAVAQAGVWLQDDVPGGKPLAAVGLGVASLALAWRRRAPLPVLATVVAGKALPALVAWESTQGGTGFVPLLIAVYSVARHAQRTAAAAGLAIAVAGTITEVLLDTGGHNLDSATWQTTMVVLVWLVGTGFRVRAERELELRARAAGLEAEREEKARAAAADERARIARELHDVVAHNVSVVAVQAGAALEVLESDPDAARAPLLAVERTARETLAEMRVLLGVLRGPAGDGGLAPQPGLGQLAALAEQVSASGVPVELRVEGEPAGVDAGVGLSAYRVVQEALTNVLKHAGPARATVVVRCAAGLLELEILDDGAGGSAETRDGHGLIGMRERVALYGGELRAGPRDGGGFAVSARLPLQEPGR